MPSIDYLLDVLSNYKLVVDTSVYGKRTITLERK